MSMLKNIIEIIYFLTSYESKPSKFDKFDLSLQAKKVNNLHNLLNKKKEFALFVKEVNKKDFEQ